MTLAASLLMRDMQGALQGAVLFPPLNGKPHEPVPPTAAAGSIASPGKAAIASEAPTSMFPVLPIADVLITERRICKACGSIHEAQSDRVHRLLSSCEGDPFKRVLRPRKPQEQPLDMKVRYTIEVLAEHCAICWESNTLIGIAWEIAPRRPKRHAFTNMQQAMEKAKARLEAKTPITKMSAAEAAEFL